MISNFYKAFSSPQKGRINFINTIFEMHNNLIGDCSTCIHYPPIISPSFVTDYGDCNINSPIFIKKVLNKENKCPNYIENKIKINKVKEKIEEYENDFI